MQVTALRDETKATLLAAQERLDQVETVRASLEGKRVGPVRLITRDSSGDISSIVEYEAGR